MLDELRDDELPDPSDWGNQDDPDQDQLPCPECGQWVHEDTQKCPHCGNWIVPADVLAGRKRRWWMVGVVLLVVLMILITIRWRLI